MSVEGTLREYEDERRRLSQLASIETEEFFKYQPLLMTPGEWDVFRKDHKTIFFDARFSNLVKLYSRFHPSDKITEKDAISSPGFTDWLKQNDIDESFMEKGARLVIPHGVDEIGNMVWNCLAVLPQNLQRQLQEASVSKMIDGETQRILHENVELIVLGASVGSNIASALVVLGVEHVTIVDPKDQDGVGSSRVSNPSHLIHGKPKAIALHHDLLLASPYLEARVFPMEFGPQIANEVLKGTMPDNPERIIIIIEEVDNLKSKDYLRQVFREKFVGKKAMTISAADTGIASVAVIAEEPKDPPYNGNALEFGNDPFAQDPNPVAKIMKTYGLVTPSTPNPTSEDIAFPPELLGSLARLFQGQINSFEQSPLASRLAGPIVGVIVIAFIENQLAAKKVSVDLSKLTNAKWESKKYVKEVHRQERDLQKKLGIKRKHRKG